MIVALPASFRAVYLVAFIGLLLAACQTPDRAASPQRVTYRQAIITDPPVAKARQTEITPSSTPHCAAAKKATDWLMAERNGDGYWASPYPVAVAALALEAGLADDRIKTNEHFRAFWEATLRFLLQAEQPSGALSQASSTEQPYEHALAARALCKASTHFSAVPAAAETARQAVRYILERQQQGGGWHYGYAQGDQRSTPLTVVQMDALFAARSQGWWTNEIDRALQHAATDLTDKQDTRTGEFGYLMRGIGTPVMNGYALYGLQLAGWGKSLSARRGWLAVQQGPVNWPTSLRRPLFPAYYSHLAHYHQGGRPWAQWESDFYNELLSGQRSDGHWPAPQREATVGSAYATALCTLMLRAPMQTAPLLDHYALPDPGPIYRVKNSTNGTITIWTATFVQAYDAYLLGPAWTERFRQFDTVRIEGQPRRWLWDWATRVEAGQEGTYPDLPDALRKRLNRQLDLPANSVEPWRQVPPWAIALHIWGRTLESEERHVDDTVEKIVLARFPPGTRPQSLLPDSLYGDILEALPRADSLTLLAHALDQADRLGPWVDRVADAWAMADEQAFRAAFDDLLQGDATLTTLYRSILHEPRQRVVSDMQQALASPGRTLYILPFWLLLGEEGVLQRLLQAGYRIERLE